MARGFLNGVAAVAALLCAGCGTVPRETPSGFWIPPCTFPPRAAIACESGGWARQVAGLRCFGPRRVAVVPSFRPDGMPEAGLYCAWTSDEWLLGYRAGRPAVLHLPGERGMEGWGREYFGRRGWPCSDVGRPRDYPERRFDSGGNVLVSPPVPPRFPLGRVVTSAQAQPAVKDMLRGQGARPGGPDNELVELDTSWLKVGHVDEIVAFVPVRGGGFRVVLPDPEAGVRLLKGVPPDRVLFAAGSGRQIAGRVTLAGPRFIADDRRDFGGGGWKFVRIVSGRGAGLVGKARGGDGRRLFIEQSWDLRGASVTLALGAARAGRADSMPIWFEAPDATSRYVAVEDSRMWLDGAGEQFPAVITAGELANDPALAATAAACARRIYGPGGVAEIMARAFGETCGNALRLPVVLAGDPEAGGVVSLVPNPVNLVCLNLDALMLAPFGPRRGEGEGATDVFVEEWTRALAGIGVRPVFLDGWNALHRLDGGARCGTNVLRRRR